MVDLLISPPRCVASAKKDTSGLCKINSSMYELSLLTYAHSHSPSARTELSSLNLARYFLARPSSYTSYVGFIYFRFGFLGQLISFFPNWLVVWECPKEKEGENSGGDLFPLSSARSVTVNRNCGNSERHQKKQEGNGPIDQQATKGNIWLSILQNVVDSVLFLQNVGENRTIPEKDKMSGEFHHPLEISICNFQASLWS